MIHIDQGTKVPENENFIVATATGDYADSALIEFYDTRNPDVILGSFEAQYIKYGGMVYRCNNHKELGEAILKIDPESTHTAASYVRMSDELLAQMDGGSLEPASLDQVLATEQVKMEDAIDNPVDSSVTTSTESGLDQVSGNPVVDENSSITTPVTTETPTFTPISTSTPENIDVNTPTSGSSDTSTTTPSILDHISDAVDTVSTTTDAISNVIDTIVDTTSTPSTP